MNHRSFLLECTPDNFRARRSATASLVTTQAGVNNLALCQRLWLAVGEGFWTERSRWSQARWLRQLQEPGVSFWITHVSNEGAGCFELTRMTRGVKIQGFGLLPDYRGRGLGRDLLTAATERGFETGAQKVWLHTATDDHPNALPNYLAGGYRIVRERELRHPMPSQSLTNQPGNRRGRRP